MTTRSLRSLSSDCIRPAFLPPLGRTHEARREARDLGRCCLPRLLLGPAPGGRVRPPLRAAAPASPRDACLPPARFERTLGGCRQSLRPLKEHKLLHQSRSLAARAGRWSAQHRKTAVLGWILFVVLATVVGGRVGLNAIDESASGSGESKRG